MKVRTETINVLLMILLVFISTPLVLSQEVEDEDYLVGGFELEKLLSFVSGIIALTLFALAYISYRRDGRKRLLYVAVAFAILSFKGFLLASETFFPDVEWIDPFLIVLEFFAMLFFFFGVMKKGG